VTTGVFPSAPRRFRAFISYSHADTPWANWLLKKLEGYQVPARFHGRAAPVGVVGPRLAPVFRDRDELPTTSDLGETILAALRESATLIVICSPSSAKSRWVREEIIAFKRLHGERRVFALIVAGEPKQQGTADDCFSPALRRELAPDGTLTGAPAEVVAADAREQGDGKSAAFIRLVAGLLGVGFDDLRQRELQRRNRRLTLIAAASFAGMVLTLGLAIAAWRARGEAVLARNDAVLARNDAQRRQDQAEDVLAFMLGDFRDDLKKVGQLALLEKVGSKAMTYFDTADARDLTDTALARQAKALTQIGEVRMEKANFSEAERAFQNAFARTSVLARRHPENGQMLFERAQAEFWLAFVAWKRGEMPRAREWSMKYRDSAIGLAALEQNSVRAQREVISAHHNLAVLEFDAGDYSAARPAFLAEAAQVRAMLVALPDELSLRLKLADIDSRLGLIEEYRGDYAAALERFGESCARVRTLVELEPAVARWRVTLAVSLTLSAAVQAIAGRHGEAAAGYAEAKTMFSALAAQDPKNQQWRLRVATVELNEAALFAAMGRPERAAEILREARVTIEKLAATEPSSQAFTRLLAKAWRLEAAIRLTTRAPDAESAANRAVEMGETLFQQRRGDDWVLSELALARIVAGQVCKANGQREPARSHWLRALEIIGARQASDDWRFLDPAAQALALLERTQEAQAVAARLRRFGYHPLDPLAASILDAALQRSEQTK
jgi:tetratricopeptide (TPR) repeat protein